MGDAGDIFLDRMSDGYLIRAVIGTGKNKQETLLQQSTLPLDWSMTLAEDYVRQLIRTNGDVKKLIDKKAKWRNNPLSEKQWVMIKRMKLDPMCMAYATYTDYLFHAENPMPKGQASEILGKRMAESAYKKG
jgi:hypothetical protein